MQQKKQQKKENLPFHWAVIGTGFIYPRHKEAIEKNGGSVVATYNEENNWRDVCKTSIPYVAVCSPNDLHFEMSKTCLDAGKIVLCEKPLVTDLDCLEDLKRYPNLYVSLQLRWHPVLLTAKKYVEESKASGKRHTVLLDIYINRDEKTVAPWKFDERRSGGVLYNIGVHYFDVLTHLFGEDYMLGEAYTSPRKGKGTIVFPNADVEWSIDITAPREKQWRIVSVDGKEINFSSKDNLSYENYHQQVYQSLKKGEGIHASDCEPSLRLIHAIYKKSTKI